MYANVPTERICQHGSLKRKTENEKWHWSVTRTLAPAIPRPSALKTPSGVGGSRDELTNYMYILEEK
jgi:hypothetical protein